MRSTSAASDNRMVDGVTAAFLDGGTARRREVALRFGESALELAEGGTAVARWSYEDIRRQDGPPGLLRLRNVSGPDLARVDIADAAAEAEIVRRCPHLDEAARSSGRTARRIVLWCLAAGLSVVLSAIYLVPIASNWLAPLVPWSVERRLGLAVDNQVRVLFGNGTCTEPNGRAALDKLAQRLGTHVQVPVPIEIEVLRSSSANALALPGGRVYVLDGLLRQAENVDEVAGVLAHELGHVAHRDNMRSLLQTAGLSFLFGMLLGDFVGGGAVMIAARSVVTSAYSREVETAADLYSVDLMSRVGGDPRALGTVLTRITGNIEPGPAILLDHPQTRDRVALINSLPAQRTPVPLLTPGEWAALKRICAG